MHAFQVLSLVSVGPPPWKITKTSSPAADSIRDSDWESLTGLESGMIFHCFLVIRGQE